MIVIRLTRKGAKKRPFFHIVAADRRFPRDGRYIEQVGCYNPVARGKEVVLKLEQSRVEYWLGQGAQLSSTARRLFKLFLKISGEGNEITLEQVEQLKKAKVQKVSRPAKAKAAQKTGVLASEQATAKPKSKQPEKADEPKEAAKNSGQASVEIKAKKPEEAVKTEVPAAEAEGVEKASKPEKAAKAEAVEKPLDSSKETKADVVGKQSDGSKGATDS